MPVSRQSAQRLRQEADQVRADIERQVLEAGEDDDIAAIVDAGERQITALRERADAVEGALTRLDDLDMSRVESAGVRHQPATKEERLLHDPAQEQKDRATRSDYKPPTWINGLPAFAQPDWVRESMGERQQEESKVYIDTFTSWMSAGRESDFLARADATALRALEEGTDSEGGYLVPEDVKGQVLYKDANAYVGGVYRPHCRVVQTGRDTGWIPTATGVSFTGTAEEATLTESDPTFGQAQFVINKRIAHTIVSRELVQDSAANVDTMMRVLVDDAKGKDEDLMIVEGSGTNAYRGIKNTGTSGAKTASSLAIGLILDAYGLLPAGYKRGAIWAGGSSMEAKILATEITANKGSLFRTYDDVLGKPLALFDAKSSSDGWDSATQPATAGTNWFGSFCNLRQGYILVDRTGLSVRRDDSVKSLSDQVVFIFGYRGDGIRADVNAFVKLGLTKS